MLASVRVCVDSWIDNITDDIICQIGVIQTYIHNYFSTVNVSYQITR